MKNRQDSFMSKPDKGVSEVRGMGGLLAGLYRITMKQLNMPYGQYENLLKAFVVNARSRTKDNRVQRMFTIGNLRREFERPEMTFKVLLKGLKILRVRHVEFSMKMTFTNGKTMISTTDLDIGTVYNPLIDTLEDEDPHTPETELPEHGASTPDFRNTALAEVQQPGKSATG